MLTTAFLWTMAVFWLSALVVGFKHEASPPTTLVSMRALFAAWPLTCLLGGARSMSTRHDTSLHTRLHTSQWARNAMENRLQRRSAAAFSYALVVLTGVLGGLALVAFSTPCATGALC